MPYNVCVEFVAFLQMSDTLENTYILHCHFVSSQIEQYEALAHTYKK